MKTVLAAIIAAVLIPSTVSADKLSRDLCVKKARAAYTKCINSCSDDFGLTSPKGQRCAADCMAALNIDEDGCSRY